MSKSMENVKTVNSVLRTIMLMAFLGIFGFLGWTGYANWIKPGLEAERIKREMAELQVKFDQQTEELFKTQTALKLVKVDHRKARIKIVEKGVDSTTEEPFFVVQFVEVDSDGESISEPREFRLRGTIMFVDCWLVKFEDRFIEQADELRSASLCVFKSIWGDIDERSGGQSLDRQDPDIKTAYGTIDPRNSFEQEIWDDFWDLANDPIRQQELGIRGNHGQAVYLRVDTGAVYEVDLRASDGLNIKPVLETQNTSTSSGPSG